MCFVFVFFSVSILCFLLYKCQCIPVIVALIIWHRSIKRRLLPAISSWLLYVLSCMYFVFAIAIICLSQLSIVNHCFECVTSMLFAVRPKLISKILIYILPRIYHACLCTPTWWLWCRTGDWCAVHGLRYGVCAFDMHECAHVDHAPRFMLCSVFQLSWFQSRDLFRWPAAPRSMSHSEHF